jgi:RHS repeat-associated protein
MPSCMTQFTIRRLCISFFRQRTGYRIGQRLLRARYYASSMGRFMSPDPIGMFVASPGQPQSWNLYSYVMNNPLNFIDPNGLDCAYLDDNGGTDRSVSRGCGDAAPVDQTERRRCEGRLRSQPRCRFRRFFVERPRAGPSSGRWYRIDSARR